VAPVPCLQVGVKIVGRDAQLSRRDCSCNPGLAPSSDASSWAACFCCGASPAEVASAALSGEAGSALAPSASSEQDPRLPSTSPPPAADLNLPALPQLLLPLLLPLHQGLITLLPDIYDRMLTLKHDQLQLDSAARTQSAQARRHAQQAEQGAKGAWCAALRTPCDAGPGSARQAALALAARPWRCWPRRCGWCSVRHCVRRCVRRLPLQPLCPALRLAQRPALWPVSRLALRLVVRPALRLALRLAPAGAAGPLAVQARLCPPGCAVTVESLRRLVSYRDGQLFWYTPGRSSREGRCICPGA